jgi:hypothetical protein
VRRRATLISADVVGRGLETVRVYRISDKPHSSVVLFILPLPPGFFIVLLVPRRQDQGKSLRES